MLLTLGTDLQKLIVQSEKMWLTVEATLVRAVLIIELERVVRLGVVLRLTFFKCELQDILIFCISDPFL